MSRIHQRCHNRKVRNKGTNAADDVTPASRQVAQQRQQASGRRQQQRRTRRQQQKVNGIRWRCGTNACAAIASPAQNITTVKNQPRGRCPPRKKNGNEERIRVKAPPATSAEARRLLPATARSRNRRGMWRCRRWRGEEQWSALSPTGSRAKPRPTHTGAARRASRVPRRKIVQAKAHKCHEAGMSMVRGTRRCRFSAPP